MQRSEVLLAIIAAGKKRALSPVQLQKVTFLVSQEFENALPDDFYRFDKYHYGPYCSSIYRDAEMLEYWGQINIQNTGQSDRRKYSISEAGTLQRPELPPRLIQFIDETVDWALDQSFQELVRSVYFMYPKYRENSVFHYSEEEAVLEQLDRSLKEYKAGESGDARTWLKELRQELEWEANENRAV